MVGVAVLAGSSAPRAARGAYYGAGAQLSTPLRRRSDGNSPCPLRRRLSEGQAVRNTQQVIVPSAVFDVSSDRSKIKPATRDQFGTTRPPGPTANPSRRAATQLRTITAPLSPTRAPATASLG